MKLSNSMLYHTCRGTNISIPPYVFIFKGSYIQQTCQYCNVSAVQSKFETNGQTSLQKMSAQVGVSRKSSKRATEVLNLKLYKVNIVQKLLSADCPKCVAFCQWLLDEFNGKGKMSKLDNVFFSDEAWFNLDGYVNFQL